jgi:hypothetical protein
MLKIQRPLRFECASLIPFNSNSNPLCPKLPFNFKVLNRVGYEAWQGTNCTHANYGEGWRPWHSVFKCFFKGATLIGPSKTFIEPWICPKYNHAQKHFPYVNCCCWFQLAIRGSEPLMSFLFVYGFYLFACFLRAALDKALTYVTVAVEK